VILFIFAGFIVLVFFPVIDAGGYEVYYLWFMAGDSGRKLQPYEDPDHRWLRNA